MKAYIIRRLLFVIPMLLAVTFISFCLGLFIPTDPAKVALRANGLVALTPEMVEEMREQLGLNDPFLIRYGKWLYNLSHLDLGNSYINNRSVVGELARTLNATLLLAFMAFVIVVFVSIPIGILSAIFKNTFFDRIMRLIVFMGVAMPNYWLSLLFIWFFALYLGAFPTNGATSLKHYILPSLALSFGYICTYVRLIRNNMLDNMKEDYIFYARARGIKERSIVFKHLLKNSFQTSINALGMSIVSLISGTFIIENIFGIPGVGQLCISSVFNRDYPIIQGYVLMMGVLFVFFNLFVDIFQAYLDPRIKKGLQKN